jgi:hypothetical protein
MRTTACGGKGSRGWWEQALAFDPAPDSSNRYGCRRVFPSRIRDNSETDSNADTYRDSEPFRKSHSLSNPNPLCGKPFAQPFPRRLTASRIPRRFAVAWRLGRRESQATF